MWYDVNLALGEGGPGEPEGAYMCVCVNTYHVVFLLYILYIHYNTCSTRIVPGTPGAHSQLYIFHVKIMFLVNEYTYIPTPYCT